MLQIGALNTYPTSTSITTGNTGDFPLTTGVSYYYWPYPWNTSVPTECAGEVHVFPCPHCDQCKCGGAMKRPKDKGKKKC